MKKTNPFIPVQLYSWVKKAASRELWTDIIDQSRGRRTQVDFDEKIFPNITNQETDKL